MQIDEKIRDDVAVLTILDKALMAGQDATLLHERVKSLVKGGIRKVVVDFSGVKWFGSPMLGTLVASLTTLRNAGGDLRLAGVTERIHNVMKATRLAGVFKMLDTVDRAVASFKAQVQ